MDIDEQLLVPVPNDVYDPREDTFFLLKGIKVPPHASSGLEMGAGSGLISFHLAKAGLKVTSVDINPASVRYIEERACKEGWDIRCVESDLFENVTGTFDLMVFNPPYLPREEWDDSLSDSERKMLVGGRHGHETLQRFLDKAPQHLSEMGELFFLSSGDWIKELDVPRKLFVKASSTGRFENERLILHHCAKV